MAITAATWSFLVAGWGNPEYYLFGGWGFALIPLISGLSEYIIEVGL